MRKFGSSEKNLFLILADFIEMLIGIFVCLTETSRRIVQFLRTWEVPPMPKMPNFGGAPRGATQLA